MQTWWMIFFFLHFLFTIGFLCVIVLENRLPEKTIAWVVTIFGLPLIGITLYLLIGSKWRKRENRNRPKPHEISVEPHHDEHTATGRLIRLIQVNVESELHQGNLVEIFDIGESLYKHIFQSIRQAKKHVHVLFYIIGNDHVGRALMELLMEKAQEGVEVRLIVDALGSKDLPEPWLAQLRAAGGHVGIFLPVSNPLLFWRVNYRNHRKVVVVDGEVGYIGGFNIGHEYLGEDPKLGYWRDTHLEIKGPAVESIQHIFLADWRMVSRERLEPSAYLAPDVLNQQKQGEQDVQVIASDPRARWELIRQTFLQMIMTAEESVYIASPYFVPDETLLVALRTATQSGIKVVMILPSISDSVLVYYASQSYIDELIDAGVEVYHYTKGFLHAKVMIVDGRLASVGTANLDRRSFNLNFEANVFLYGRTPVLHRLIEQFEKDLSNSVRLRLQSKNLVRRYKESFARLFAPLL
ncbi:cardiolipin synthase [Brevibacillus dissolubilis]|uniref:cardiolipin synthase n=1 Tax=Brevibacillus dissolubilis TaxID=1844116 RepID=UPI001115D383|nr:cardiolipin synthase [Brevibacillus dissolubilis]